jgi:hypothetical protein
MTFVVRFAAACALGIAALACHDEPNSTETLAGQTAAAKAHWQAARPGKYSFVASRICECAGDAAGPVLVTVQNTSIVSVTRVDTGAGVDPTLWFHIDALFALIDTELSERPELLEVTYDVTLGYPSRVAYGHREVDGGAVIDISAFQVLQSS